MVTIEVKLTSKSVKNAAGNEIGVIEKDGLGNITFKSGTSYLFNCTAAEFAQVNDAIIAFASE